MLAGLSSGIKTVGSSVDAANQPILNFPSKLIFGIANFS
jgi:hypothetical protein